MVQRMKWYTLANDKVTKEERASFKWADVQCNSVVSSSIVRSESSCMENGFAYLSFSFIMMSALFALLPVWAIECVCVCCTVRYAYLLILLVSFSFAHFIYFVFLVGFFVLRVFLVPSAVSDFLFHSLNQRITVFHTFTHLIRSLAHSRISCVKTQSHSVDR